MSIHPLAGATERYIADRERILGGHRPLHDDPAIAARQLAVKKGETGARTWARALVATLERER